MKVATVQMALRSNRLEDVRQTLCGWAARAKDHEVDLVVFPAYTGLFALEALSGSSSSFGPGLPDLIGRYGALLVEFLEDWGRETACRLGLHLAAGTVLVPEGKGIAHQALLFGPDGRVFRQAQTHVSKHEREWGLLPGDDLEVFKVRGVNTGLVVATDVWFPEVGRILTLKSASLLLAFTAMPRPYGHWRQMAGMWQQVQQNQVFCAESCLIGSLGNEKFAGRSSLYGPCEITDGETGIIEQLQAPDQEGLLIASFDFEALARIREEYPIHRHFNRRLYQSAFPGVYRNLLFPATSGQSS